MTTSSAPGKIILFGEHAVVYGRPALAVPVTEVQAAAIVTDLPDNGTGGSAQAKKPDRVDWRKRVLVEAQAIGLSSDLYSLPPDEPLASTILLVFDSLGVSQPPACKITIKSTIPIASGLGSGAAVSVALIRALSTHIHRPLTDEQVNRLAFEIERLLHGTPSGIDNTVVTYCMPVFFVKGEAIRTLQPGAPLTLVIADTGVSAPTRESVADVRGLWKTDKPHMERLFDQVGEISRKARAAVESGDLPLIGELMNSNHALLQEMTVSSPELDRLVVAARAAGAMGAKLSGGGRGGNMIALVDSALAGSIATALETIGARRTIVTTISPQKG